MLGMVPKQSKTVFFRKEGLKLGQTDSTAIRTFALHIADRGSTPSILYGLPSLPGIHSGAEPGVALECHWVWPKNHKGGFKITPSCDPLLLASVNMENEIFVDTVEAVYGDFCKQINIVKDFQANIFCYSLMPLWENSGLTWCDPTD